VVGWWVQGTMYLMAVQIPRVRSVVGWWVQGTMYLMAVQIPRVRANFLGKWGRAAQCNI